jgi:SAM-dependent methyltransferase
VIEQSDATSHGIDYARLAHVYAQHRAAHPGVLESLCAAIRPGDAVLEVGCGTGNYIAAIESLTSGVCWGLDPSEEMLAQARVWPTRVRWLVGRAEQLDLDVKFDLIYTVDAIHHLTDPARYYREVYRLLKVGGRICTVTDSAWIIRNRQPLATYFPETIEVELRRYPRIAALRTMMQQAGLDEIEERMAEWSYALTDLGAYRDRVFSALHLIPDEAFRRGLGRMERDLCDGPIPCVSRYTLLWGRKT